MTNPVGSAGNTAGDVASRMVAALNASEPDLDASVGTPLRKIIDAVSESIAEAYADQHLINYQYDIDSKTGGDLDDFCALFGITRLPAQRAQGVVTFTRPNDTYAQTTAVVLSPGTQVLAQTNPLVYAATTVSAVLDPGVLSIDVPVQAIISGSQGNIPAGLLTTLVTSVSGVTTCTNAQALTGGSNAESDDDLRIRFKATVFRSLAGTQAMYQAIATSVPADPSTPLTPAVTLANVVGSTKRHREQIQMVSGTASSTLQHAAFIYVENVFIGADIDAGDLLVQNNEWSWLPNNPTNGSDATVAINSLHNMPDGFYDVDFEYVPQASRNDPGGTRFSSGVIDNRVDVWCNGQVLKTATQTVVWAASMTYNTSTDPNLLWLNASKWEMSNQGLLTPPVGYVHIPLSFGPIVALPSSMVIGGTTYVYGTDYWFSFRKDAFGLAARSSYGIAWQTTRMPANGTVFTLTYTYNAVPRLVQDSIDLWRLVGTDALAHAGRQIPIKFHFAIVYDRRYDSSTVNTAIDSALSAMVNGLGFDAQLQVSDVLQTVHNVPGVDNVRFLTNSDDASNYAMQQMSVYSPGTAVSVYASGGRAIDVTFGDDQYPVYYGSRIITKANNTFGIGA